MLRSVLRPWLLLALIIIFGAVLRGLQLEYAPVGGHGDVAWKGINALDWIDRGVFPYYVWELYAPEPVNVILPGLLIPFTGVSYLAGRVGTVITGVLLIAFAYPAAWWLLYDSPVRRRELAGLLAALAVATSMHANYLSRLGMRAAIFPMQVMLLTWLTAWAWHKGGWWRWALGGVALAFMQYTYIPGRLFPGVLALWFGFVFLAHRAQWRQRWWGWLVLIGVGALLALPNIITFIVTPESFTARADTGTATTGGWIWLYDSDRYGGMWSLLLQKIGRELMALGTYWDGPYNVMHRPMLTPLFYAGLLVAGGLALFQRRSIALWWPLLGIPLMLLTDLISGAVLEVHALRQTGVLPFVFLLAGVGLAAALERLWSLLNGPALRWAAIGVLSVAALLPTLQDMGDYLGEFIPDQYADPRTGWLTEQIDVDLSRRIIAEPERSYLVPYDEYNRANIAFLTAQVYRDRRSALDETGTLRVFNPPDTLTIVTTSSPDRIRHDGRESVWDKRLWVLLHQDWAFYLPPLLPEQVEQIEAILSSEEPERLIDRSATEIAQLYHVATPPGLFQSRPALLRVVPDAAFALPGAEPEVRLAGYDLPSATLEPGALTYVTLYWQPLRERLSEDYEVFVQVWNDAGEYIAGTHDFPNGGTYRPRIWQSGQTTITYHWFRLPDDLPPGAYTLVAGLYRVLHNEPLTVTGISANPNADAAWMRDLRVLPGFTPQPGTPPPADLRFGPRLHVATFDAAAAGETLDFGETWTLPQGAALDVRFGWDVLSHEAADLGLTAPPSPDIDYSLFLHLTAEDDAPPVSQADAALGAGVGLPSGVWYAGDIWQDTLTLPLDVPPGTYTLWAGVYYYLDGVRLTPVLDERDQPDGRVRLAQVIITE